MVARSYYPVHINITSRGGGGGVTQGETIYTHVKYALKFKESVIDYFSSNFCFLADEVLRKVAGD